MKTYNNLQKEISGEPLDESMTSKVAKMTAIGLKKRGIGHSNDVDNLGNQVLSEKDLGKKLDLIAKQNISLSKQMNTVAGIGLVAVSMSDDGLLSKSLVLTSLLSSHEPDENLDRLFEDEVSVN